MRVINETIQQIFSSKAVKKKRKKILFCVCLADLISTSSVTSGRLSHLNTAFIVLDTRQRKKYFAQKNIDVVYMYVHSASYRWTFQLVLS